jgi:hypothetical protein
MNDVQNLERLRVETFARKSYFGHLLLESAVIVAYLAYGLATNF